MEFGTIEREIFVEAAPEVVFDVVSSPAHLREWWPDEASYAPGEPGSISFGDTVLGFAVVDARPPRTFSFRWTHPVGETAAEDNSLLVTFELTPSGGGTLLRMTETGLRDEQEFREHETGWDFYLPRIAPYAATLAVRP